MTKPSENLEIPLGKRTAQYRFFEMLPAILSYGTLLLMVVLSVISPVAASIFLFLVIISLLVKAVGIAIRTIQGSSIMLKAQEVNWHKRLESLQNPKKSYAEIKNLHKNEFQWKDYLNELKYISRHSTDFPKPSDIYNAIIIATYNESYDILQPTVQSVLDTTYSNDHIILVIAYEERGGADTEKTVKRLQEEYKDKFFAFEIVKHPKDLPNEVIGKGGNITYAGRFLQKWLRDKQIKSEDVIVTTLDSDNRPFYSYFDCLTYQFIVHENRKHMSFQPIALFTNNIWDAPAPMRVVATGNSFWNVISSMRPHSIRNFASHSQPMDALEETDFWSTRTIVEDGHQYWRSYFRFKGDYEVLPVHLPIYQDAVLSDTFRKTLKAQFIQTRRWAYGASDVPYVASRVFTKDREVSFGSGVGHLIRLIDGNVTLATTAILVAFGGWIPLLVNPEAARSFTAHQLPNTVSSIQQIAMIGLFITIFVSFKILPPRPERYKKRRSFGMLIQWVLMPFTAIAYSASSALYSQGRLLFGKYIDKFDVTEKATIKDVDRVKQEKASKKKSTKSKSK